MISTKVWCIINLYAKYISYAYLLNVEPRNWAFLKTSNTELDEILITFKDQIVGPLEKEYKVNLTLLINK